MNRIISKDIESQNVKDTFTESLSEYDKLSDGFY